MEGKMPVFVKVEDYKEVLEIVNEVKEKISEINTTLTDLENLKEQEDAEIQSWKAGIDDIENKMHYIDQTLFEPDSL